MATQYGLGRYEVGRWASTGSFTGLIVKVDNAGDVITLYNPGNNNIMNSPKHLVALKEGNETRVRMEVMMDIPEGFTEAEIRRWLVTLLDPELQIRAESSLSLAGYDTAAHKIVPRLDITRTQ